jgi:mono/diheme cytochrome c family protein
MRYLRCLTPFAAAGIATAVLLSACANRTVDMSEASTAVTGQSLYARHCSACHGPLGEGDGPVADTMRVTVPNLRTLRARSNGVFPREIVASYIDGRDLPPAHGDRYMPVWGEVLAAIDEDGTLRYDAVSNQRITAIVDYLQQIQN